MDQKQRPQCVARLCRNNIDLIEYTLQIPVSLRSTRPSTLIIPTVKFDFLTLLPATESLACKGRRLHDTALQRQQRTYAPDVNMQVQVVSADHRLTVSFVDDQHLTLLQGENKTASLWLVNAGSHPVSEVWMVCGPDDEIWIGDSSALEGRKSPHMRKMSTDGIHRC